MLGPDDPSGDIAMRTTFGALLAGVGLFCLAVPVVAHHSFAYEQ
jgi:hypothetical protein